MAFVAALAAALFTFWLFRGLRHDDAYIALQFARNVGSGHGFVFNPGERVFGATSPLHVALLAGVYAVAGDVLAPAAILIGTLAVGAQAWLLFLILRRTSRLLAALVGVLLAAGFMGSHPWLALETNLFAALVLGVIWSLDTRREGLCGVLLGLAFLCRYDAGLLVPICVIGWWQGNGLFPKRLLLAAFLVVAPWLGWTMFYFGSLLPQTFHAKQRISEPGVYFAQALIRFARLPERILPEAAGPRSLWITPLFWASGWIFVLHHARQTRALCAYGIALLIAYSWIGPHPEQYWHLYLAEMTFALLFVLGSAGWLVMLCRSTSSRSPRLAVLSAGVVSALLVWSAVRQTGDLVRTYPTDHWLGKRHNRYVEVAGWLGDHVPPGRVVLAPEVGTLGYLSGFRMVDPFGLINNTNAFPRVPTIENLAQLIGWRHPDVVILDSPSQGALIERLLLYRIVKVYDWDPWSTVLVRGPEVLNEPSEFAGLRERLPDRARAALDAGTP